MQELTFQSQEEFQGFFENNKGLSILLFRSETCNVCPLEEKALNKIQTSLGEVVKTFRIDVDKNKVQSDLADAFNVEILPSMLFLNNTQIIEVRDPRFPTSPFILQGYYRMPCMKKIIVLIVQDPLAKIDDFFFRNTCLSCSRFNKKTSKCFLFKLKVYPFDECKKHRKNIKYNLY
jgi:uncharacterized protein YeeX (DUF496 family)